MTFPDASYEILIVDDEPGLLNLARIFLEMEEGLKVTTALSAAQALELIAANHFDAIVSDYQMPGMDGIALLKEVRSRHIGAPFVLFTGRGREDVAIAALNSGADFYVQKGGDPKSQFAELWNAIKYSIHRKEAEELVQSIVNNAPLMIMIVDKERRIQTFNKAMLEFTRTTPGELLGLRCGPAFSCVHSIENSQGCGYSSHCDQCRLWGAIQRTISDGERCLRVETDFSTGEKADAKIILLVSTAPIRAYGKKLALVFLEDFTGFPAKTSGQALDL